MEIVVFGAGSLGSLIGGVLATEHDVTLVARESHARAIERTGLKLEGALETTVHPEAVTDGHGLAADLAIVTVKSFDTERAAETLATGSFEAVLSLQNGMGNEERLARYLEAPVLAGTATYGALLIEPGTVRCTGLGEIVLGPRNGGTSPVADRVGAAFDASSLETTVSASMPHRLWEKLAVNAGINPITALADIPNGAILEAPARELARACVRETARTARAHDVLLSNRVALESLESVARATAKNTSSMRQDVNAGRRTEIEAINGYVLAKAETVGLETPTNRTLVALLETWERKNASD
ncbi:2-dehydropantoate 2-reductase [Halobacteria archaeon AArc-curdl1]|uniref:2-dehydropantoate 2-reductase n=1 Tax=Natronosalvus hydrolyticus TaxID=2979988 RepID=A0AAP2ZB73_9EURY|nr:2-dehydropantoate 2-reductase [Halobacteria archaeon AArc-curdl1]